MSDFFPDSAPQHGSFVQALRQGMDAMVRRPLFYVYLAVVVTLAGAPVQYLSGVLGESMERFVKVAERMMPADGPGAQRGAGALDGMPSEAEAIEARDATMTCCGSLCGNGLISFFILVPVLAGAAMAGAEAAAGRGRAADIFLGFRRYFTVLGVGILSMLLGGGVAVVASMVASLGARKGATAAASAAGHVAGHAAETAVWAVLAFTAVCMLWLSARLWLALYRVVDPMRPRMGMSRSLRWSWDNTAGLEQWKLTAVLVVGGVLIGCMQIPVTYLEVGGPETTLLVQGVVAGVLAVFVWVPVSLAVSGAIYIHMAAVADATPPPPPGIRRGIRV
ncbi:MAG: hypothetical protein U0636_10290 [Phycisphaerales bacterium]